MTTLHFSKAEISDMSVASDGSITIEITDEAVRSLVAAAGRHRPVLDSQDGQRQTYLRGLSNEQLVSMASSRFGGPEPDVAAEAARRIQGICERLRPAIEAARSAGLFAAS